MKNDLDKENNIVSLRSIIPNNYIIPNNKLANAITKDIIGIGNIDLLVSKKGSRKEVVTIVNLDYNCKKTELYTECEKITQYDRIVNNAVSTIYEAGNNIFTPQMVYRAINGLTKNEKVSLQAVTEVTNSLDKLSKIRCKIDWTNEAKARGINIQSGTIEENILETKKIIVTVAGRTIEAYKLLDKPILYFYAQKTKQVITVPVTLLQTKQFIKNTKDVIIIREYLIRRIEILKKNKKQSNKILYASIFQQLGMDTSIKSQAVADKTKKIRKAVTEILSYWEKQCYIKNFAQYKEGREFKGISIFY